MRITLTQCEIRSWQQTDAESIARHANNRKIWRNLRDAFPHPYSLDDAHRFITMALKKEPETYFCISSAEQAIGSIGYILHDDVARFTAEMGYWVSEEFWGRGIATEAVRALTTYAMQTHDLHRIYAEPYAWNAASCRVLQKAGFVCEGRMRMSAFKDGQVVDQMLYAAIRQDLGI